MIIYNLSIQTGCVPHKLKCSKIIPVHKSNSVYDCNNYRPISLLSYIDKILEKLIHRRLYQYLMNINFFCDNQYGFRPHHNTELALLSLTDRIYNAINEGNYVILLSVDLRKAFDVIRHDILIDKLEHIGIKDFMLKWFQSYLSERPHQTLANGSLSDNLISQSGVPQGSSLGPLLYLIYINDIKQLFPDNHLNIFADDTCLISLASDLKEAVNDMNNKLRELDNFLSANGLKINESKTEFMLLKPKGKKIIDSYKVFFKDKALKETLHTKMLGFHINNTLSFSNHIDTLIKTKLRKYLPILFKLRNSMTKKCLLQIYYSNVYSLLSYCILVYNYGNIDAVNRLERLQKRILKVIFNTSSKNIDIVMKQNGIFSLTQIYRYKLLTLGHSIIYNIEGLPKHFRNIYREKSLLSLRNKFDFVTPYYRTSMGQRCLDYKLAKEWNKLPSNMKTISNSKLFQSKLKTFLLNKDT